MTESDIWAALPPEDREPSKSCGNEVKADAKKIAPKVEEDEAAAILRLLADKREE